MNLQISFFFAKFPQRYSWGFQRRPGLSIPVDLFTSFPANSYFSSFPLQHYISFLMSCQCGLAVILALVSFAMPWRFNPTNKPYSLSLLRDKNFFNFYISSYSIEKCQFNLLMTCRCSTLTSLWSTSDSVFLFSLPPWVPGKKIQDSCCSCKLNLHGVPLLMRSLNLDCFQINEIEVKICNRLTITFDALPVYAGCHSTGFPKS